MVLNFGGLLAFTLAPESLIAMSDRMRDAAINAKLTSKLAVFLRDPQSGLNTQEGGPVQMDKDSAMYFAATFLQYINEVDTAKVGEFFQPEPEERPAYNGRLH